MEKVENKTCAKNKILLSGWIDLGPIGRHGLSFLSTLLRDDRNDIYLDSDYLDLEGKAQKIIREILNDGASKIKYTKNHAKNMEFDYMLFFHVLGVNYHDKYYNKAIEKNAKVKICYPVFDGSMPPLEWVDKINSDFDICLSPSAYCIHNLQRAGVTIDAVSMECIVLIDDLLKTELVQNKFSVQAKRNKNFRFGCISGYEARKNLMFLVESFAKTFTKEDKVELFIHSVNRPNILTPYSEFEELVKGLQETCNITLSSDFLSHEEILNIWNSFDAYVIPQTATGYYTTPVEALACGLPVILSDIPVHRELAQYVPTEDNLFFVEHSEYSPTFHFVFNYRQLGVEFNSKEELYSEALRYIYINKESLCTIEKALLRKKYAQYFTTDGLINKHNFLFNPENIAISSETYIDTTHKVLFLSKKLADKYQTIHPRPIVAMQCNRPKIEYPEESSPIFCTLENVAQKSQKLEFLIESQVFQSANNASSMQKN